MFADGSSDIIGINGRDFPIVDAEMKPYVFPTALR
jgi:hypothetical protein